MTIGRRLARHDIKEKRLEFFSDGATRPCANRAIVKLTNGGDLGGRAAKERFVCAIHFIASDAFFNHLNTHILCHGQHRVAGDAVKAGRQIRRIDFSASDNEHVLAGTFRDIALGVEQQRFIVAVCSDFLVGQDGVDVITTGFCTHQRDIDMVTCKGRGFHADAFAQAFFAQIGAPGPGRDGAMNSVVDGADSHFFRADPNQRTQVTRFQVVTTDHLALCLC